MKITAFPPQVLQALDEADFETLKGWLAENDINLADETGYTLLMQASIRQAYESGHWLVSQGADISLTMKTGYNAIDLAYFAGEIAMGAYSTKALDFAHFLETQMKAEDPQSDLSANDEQQ